MPEGEYDAAGSAVQLNSDRVFGADLSILRYFFNKKRGISAALYKLYVFKKCFSVSVAQDPHAVKLKQ